MILSTSSFFNLNSKTRHQLVSDLYLAGWFEFYLFRDHSAKLSYDKAYTIILMFQGCCYACLPHDEVLSTDSDDIDAYLTDDD